MESNVGKFELYFDISATETPDFEKLCVTSVSVDSGETLDTWFDLCSKFANNVRVAMDLTLGVTVKLDKTDPVAQFILGKEYAVGSEATASARWINLLKGSTGKQLDFTSTISNISYEATTEAVLEVTFDLKVYDNQSVVETDYSAPSV